MKIPTSSSILLASLAVSSSSSCLAAPTGTGPQDNGMSSSPSFSSSPASAIYHTGMNAHERPDTIVQRTAGIPVSLESRDSVIGTLVNGVQDLPLVGPILGPVFGKLLAPAHSLDVTDSAPIIDAQQLANFQNAAEKLNRIFNNSGSNSTDPSGTSSSASAPGPSASAASDGSAGADPSSNAASSSAPAAADPSSSATGSSASATPPSPSPTSPVVPPNTPVN